MNFRKLITYLTMGTAAAMPLAVAQNPTILQGSYISNVFGNSNFIKNPNAQTNIADVTVSNATVTRSTTTPLVATSEFLVTTSTATGSATWATRTFDSGMKGQNCEARFSYRGFSVGSTTAQILQGANVVAQLTLTASTDPRIASINFPCGDLSSATTFRLQQATASLTGTNEIGGIYVGLATNMANVAQAEFVGSITLPGGTNCIPTSTSTTYALMTGATNCGTASYTGNLQNFSQDPFGFEIRNLKLGTYQVVVSGSGFGLNSNGESRFYLQDTTNSISSMQKRLYTAAAGESVFSNETFTLEYTSQPSSTATFRFYALKSPSGNASFYGNATNFRISVYRFPSSSELVVTPERQNVWAAIRWSNSGATVFQSVVNNTWTSGSSTLFSDSYATAFGKASLTGANSSQIRISNMPVGYYRIKYNGSNYANTGTATPVFPECRSRIFETSTSTTVSQNAWFGMANVVSDVVSPGLEGVFYNSAVGDRTFRLDIAMSSPTTGLASQRCGFFSGLNETGATSAGAVGSPWMIVQPLDQPSNSALYVQGPVKAAETGAAIPEGYVNEFATRSISDTSLREQLTPTVETFYYPWTGTLTLPAGNWMLCYKGLFQYKQTVSSGNVGFLRSHVQNQTDNTVVMQQTTLGQLSQTPYVLEYLWSPMSQCKPIAITTSKTFRIGIAYGNNSGTPTVNALTIRGDVSTTELYAIRLN